MNAEVVSISADATIGEAVLTLVNGHISGMPVVDDQQQMVGIISEFQLLEAVYSPEVKSLPVRNLMTSDVITIEPTAALSDVTNLLVMHRIRRVPVVDDGRLVGIVSRRDLLKSTLEPSQLATSAH